MARSAIEIVLDAKKRGEKERTKAKIGPYYPFEAATHAAGILGQQHGNNKSEWIKQLANAAALILCEIETIQAIKGDGIIQQ